MRHLRIVTAGLLLAGLVCVGQQAQRTKPLEQMREPITATLVSVEQARHGYRYLIWNGVCELTAISKSKLKVGVGSITYSEPELGRLLVADADGKVRTLRVMGAALMPQPPNPPVPPKLPPKELELPVLK